jgi:hypothetical protein
MLWTVRGTKDQKDVTIVVEAESRESAEYMGWRRGIPVVIVEEATPAEVEAARQARLLWRYTPESRHTAFGRPVHAFQLASLMLSGVLTVVVLLSRVGHWS